MQRGKLTVEERLHYALALLSGLEWTSPFAARDCCPVCGWPKGGHDGTRHEPGCSLEAVLRDEVPHRLIWLEETYGDAAYGADRENRREYGTPVVEATASA